MRFGASTFIWVSPFSNETLGLIRKVRGSEFGVRSGILGAGSRCQAPSLWITFCRSIALRRAAPPNAERQTPNAELSLPWRRVLL